MTSVRRSLALSFAAKYSDLAISFVSVMVIARLLTPAEIGIYSVAAAFVALAQVVRDFGIGNYLIQERELTTERVRTALGIVILFAWGMAIAIFLASGPIARFYDEPGLKPALVIFGATFLIVPFNSPVLALLRRDMAFGPLYVIGVANALVHAATAITLAYLGFGFMSLAWASLAGAVATVLVATIFRPSQAWVMPSLSEWRSVASFGSVSSATAIVTQVGVQAIDLVVARMIGFAAAGLYSRANGLAAVFHRDVMGAIISVALPAFAIEHRDNRDLKASYLRGLSFVTLIAWPFYGFLALMAFPIVRILFGDQWDAAVPLVQILSVAVAVGASWNLIGSVLIASGQIRRVMKSELIIQPSRIFLIVVAAPFGLEAVAGSQIIVYLIGLAVYYRALNQVTKVTFTDFFDAITPSLGITCSSIVAPLVVILLMHVDASNIWPPILIAMFGSVAGWIIGLALTSHPAKSELRLMMVRLVGQQ